MKEEVLTQVRWQQKEGKYLNERINQYNDLARSTNNRRKWLMKSAVMHWKMGDEDMAEWHEETSDGFFQFAFFNEEEATMLCFLSLRANLPVSGTVSDAGA